jgi:hypothetical protein
MGRHLARASPSRGDRGWPRHTLQSSTPSTPRGPTEGGSIAAAAACGGGERERQPYGMRNGERKYEMREAEEKEDGRAGSWVLKPGAWTVDEASHADALSYGRPC